MWPAWSEIRWFRGCGVVSDKEDSIKHALSSLHSIKFPARVRLADCSSRLRVSVQASRIRRMCSVSIRDLEVVAWPRSPWSSGAPASLNKITHVGRRSLGAATASP